MRLKIKTIEGNRIQIYLNAFDTCELLKLKIEKGSGITRDKQKLIFDNTILEVDNIQLKNYGICDGSTIDLFMYTRNLPMEISLKIKDGKEVILNVMKKDKIIEVKRYIQNKIDISPNQQMLVYKDRFLDDSQTLKSYNIIDDTALTIFERFQHPIEVTIKTNFNVILKFNLYPNEEVLNLKNEIYEKTKVKVNKQKLFYNANVLKNEKSLDKYDIIEDSEIYLEAESQNVIFKKLKIFHPSTEAERKRFKKLRIVELKRKIITRLNLIPEEHKLTYKGKILPEHKTTSQCQINFDSSIQYIKAETKISINSNESEPIDVYVMKSEKIIDLKWIICDKMGVIPNRQRLTFNNCILEDDQTINECKIEEGSIININTFKMQLFAQLNGGKIYTLYVNKFDPIIKAKQQMKTLCGLKPEEQLLVFKYGFLKNEKTLHDYLIADQSILNVMSKMKTFIRIIARTVDETEYLIDIIENEQVLDLKRKIESKSRINVEEQGLTYKGYNLENEKTVDEYGIVKYSVIDVTETKKKFLAEAL